MSPAIIASIELPLMNLRYLGSADRMNSALEAGDIFESEGMMTETKSAAPPIHATIAPMWRIRRTRNSASAICSNQFGVEGSDYYDVLSVPQFYLFPVENIEWERSTAIWRETKSPIGISSEIPLKSNY